MSQFLFSTHFQVGHEAFHLAGLQHGEHGLSHVEGVPPVVVLDWPVVLLDTENPATQDLQVQYLLLDSGASR